jgi:hypothetical protein
LRQVLDPSCRKIGEGTGPEELDVSSVELNAVELLRS